MITKLTKKWEIERDIGKLYGRLRRYSVGKKDIVHFFVSNLLRFFFLLRKYEVEMPTLKPFLFLTDGMGKTFFYFCCGSSISIYAKA